MTEMQRKTLTPLITSIFGAINGLLVGLIADEARIRYLNYEMSQAARQYANTDWAVDFVDAYRRPLVPLICILALGAISYLVHRYFTSRPKVLLFLWFTLGAIAVWAGYLMTTANPTLLSYVWLLSFAVVSYLAYRFWANHPYSYSSLWLAVGISCVIVIAVGVQVVGLFFHWPELRSPLIWLLCLLGVIVISMTYGRIVQSILVRFLGTTFRVSQDWPNQDWGQDQNRRPGA